MVDNQEVCKDTGIDEFPPAPEDFAAALKPIKEKNTPVMQLYINDATQWTLSKWDYICIGASGDKDYTNMMTSYREPFAAVKVMNTIYKILYHVSNQEFIKIVLKQHSLGQKKWFARGKMGIMSKTIVKR
ncbi:hypothetical protein [Enterococcus faecium]|uniref:hypothetical protein n=1 Tax=Enterococcus faecium TaxID=1352 RepID=UPI001FD8619D|nr:hypothetical protein [Enterococcus faecium]